MKRRTDPTPAWIVDYSVARGHAIRWLGDRYLLARPINGKQSTWPRVPAAFESPTPATARPCRMHRLPQSHARSDRSDSSRSSPGSAPRLIPVDVAKCEFAPGEHLTVRGVAASIGTSRRRSSFGPGDLC